jgi:hypothetical protein
MVVWCNNIDTKKDFLERFWWLKFSTYLELWIFLLSILLNENNSLEAHF